MRRPIETLLLLFMTIMPFFSCDPGKGDRRYDHLDRRTRIRLMQYRAEGKRLYMNYCSNCHQEDGRGLARLYPPLKNSDYIINNPDSVVCGIRHGHKGEMTVNGVMFNQEMPPIPQITDLEIAEIATYVFTEFADTVLIISQNDVRRVMKNCEKVE